ncbi:hypothetical protein N665_0483s0007 [Sinapis alba]|nr:hypothetical protein N665_0483s0007 [Sinapis alba]
MRTGNETVESDDQNKRCVMDDPKSQDEAECIVTDESSQEEEDENMSHSEDKNTSRQGRSKPLSVNGKSMRLRFKRGKFSDTTVVLKHQETQKKRDSGVLWFNNVIEETANKLVETRKSKVKALVGAFESVISLQERKSSSPILLKK